jgi:YcxB-like protein
MPRIEYQLSFENYLEMTASRQTAPRYRAALVAAFLGATLIAAGYIYLRQSPPEGFTYIGGILLATGLLSTALAMLLGLLAKPKSRKTPKTTLQHEYENHFCDKKAIEFDEQGWRVFWYQGEDVRQWSNVTAIHNLKTLLVLATETTYYWFPKSALEPDGHLDRLKALAEQAIGKHVVLFRIPMRPSPVVFVAANLIHNWRRHVKTLPLCYFAAILVIYWVVFANRDNLGAPPVWLLGLAPLLFVFCECMYYLLNYLRADWENSANEVEIMTDYIGYRSGTVHWICKYRALENVREVPEAFQLYFEPDRFHLIPKRGFTQNQSLQFRQVLLSNRLLAG